ncbi:Scr1 family TA system antitoxin-like transcriptional regulator [Streptosporangium sp. CA-115845]|uniref:Scr1 family TA system antitoxin-like transcriptional regulator n=1 Tax=Streptosporangium sp. CA-115845 TaxID=3240071 RepID=UPI003D8FD744
MGLIGVNSMSLPARLKQLFQQTIDPETGLPYTQRQAAKIIRASGTPITGAYLSKLMKSENPTPSIQIAVAIARFFGVTAESLLGQTAPFVPPPIHSRGTLPVNATPLPGEAVHPFPAHQVRQAHAGLVNQARLPNRIGGRLRLLREDKGVSIAEAAATVELDEAVLVDVETGTVELETADLNTLLVLYGVVDPYERDLLLSVARGERDTAWWYSYIHGMPLWFLTYLAMEDGASLIRSYFSDGIPPLLQTMDYVRAARRATHHPDPAPEHVELAVRLVAERQARLMDTQAVKIWAVIQESALLNMVGNVEVQIGLINHLIEATRQGNVALQVNRTGGSRYLPRGGSFNLFRFPGPAPDVVYVPRLVSDNLVHDPLEVSEYLQAHSRLSLSAEPISETESVLKAIRDRIIAVG